MIEMKMPNQVTDTTLTRAAAISNGLTLTWSDGHVSFFHFVWLRDVCHCPLCGNCYDSNRLLLPSDVSMNVRPEEVAVGAGEKLVIRWAGDGHQSEYDADWLRRHCYDDESRNERRHVPILWDADICKSLPEVEYSDALQSDAGRLNLFRKLRDFGFVIVRNGPSEPGSVVEVAGMVGALGDAAYSKVFDLTPKSKIRTAGNSTRMVPPHTDEAFRLTPPGINVLSCVRPADDGGDTILVDGFHIANILRDENPVGFGLLAKYASTYVRQHEGTLDQRARTRVIALDDGGQVSGIRLHTRASGPLDLPVKVVEPYYAAYRRLSELMMSPANQARLRLNAGDTAFFDNHRALHARTHFTDPERFLQICNVSREGFHENLRLLLQKLGHAYEADHFLPAGMAY